MGGRLSGFCPVCPALVRFLSGLSGFWLTSAHLGKLGNLSFLQPMVLGTPGQKIPFFQSRPKIWSAVIHYRFLLPRSGFAFAPYSFAKKRVASPARATSWPGQVPRLPRTARRASRARRRTELSKNRLPYRDGINRNNPHLYIPSTDETRKGERRHARFGCKSNQRQYFRPFSM